jgi:hypothetical protein
MSAEGVSSFLQEIQKGSIETTVRRLLQLRNAHGKIERDTYNDAIQSLASIGIVMPYAALRKRVSRASKVASDDILPTEEVTISVDGFSGVSTLTPATLPNVDDATDDVDDATDDVDEATAGVSKRGRPKGITDAYKREMDANYKDCVNSITLDYISLVGNQSKRLSPGALCDLVKSKKEEYEIERDISLSTIRSRARPGRQHAPAARGVVSPLVGAEDALVVICIQMGKIRQPLNVSEGIALMNDMIVGTTFEEELICFQEERQLGDESFQRGTVTTGWWRGFKSRYRHRLTTKRGERFACNRADWTKLRNIVQMYDVIYDELVDAGVAIKLDSPVFTDRNGKEVSKNERFGKEQDIKITHNHYILFADETGCNTLQKKDGQVGGTKLIVERGTKP